VPHRSRLPLLLAALGAAGSVGLVLAPVSQAAPGVPPVAKGVVTQAFRATTYAKPTQPVVPSVRYYLAGTPSDDGNKSTGSPTAGFSRTAPDGSTDVTQSTNVVTSGGGSSANDPGNAFWTGPYKLVLVDARPSGPGQQPHCQPHRRPRHPEAEDHRAGHDGRLQR
jgi:hypothetical protein